MATLREYAAGVEDILRPYGDLDLLLYYGLIAEKLQVYLHGREPLAWFYFVPRKYMGFHYATNREGEHREINRVVYAIERGRDMPAEDAIEVAALLAQAVQEDDHAAGLLRGRPFVSWTGSSFNVTLSLNALQPASFYKVQIEYTGKGHTLTDRLIAHVIKASKVPVAGGPVRPPGHITVDPSQTPSGQLCRVPIGSIHMESASAIGGVIGGVSVPLTLDMLHRDEVADLLSYTPRRVIGELDKLSRRLPV